MSEGRCTQTALEIIILYSCGFRSKRESPGKAVDGPEATLRAKHISSRGCPLPNMQAWKTKITYQQLYTLILHPSVVRALSTCSLTVLVAMHFYVRCPVSLVARPTAWHASAPNRGPEVRLRSRGKWSSIQDTLSFTHLILTLNFPAPRGSLFQKIAFQCFQLFQRLF